MREHISVDAERLDIDSRDIAEIKKAHARQRILLLAAGALTAVLSFVAGSLARDAFVLGYPYAIGSSISGAAAVSSPVNRRFAAIIIALVAAASFVLGILLTGGETQNGAYPQDEVPEYGVYRMHPVSLTND